MSKYIIKEKEKLLTIQAGWYTEAEMKETLDYDVTLS